MPKKRRTKRGRSPKLARRQSVLFLEHDTIRDGFDFPELDGSFDLDFQLDPVGTPSPKVPHFFMQGPLDLVVSPKLAPIYSVRSSERITYNDLVMKLTSTPLSEEELPVVPTVPEEQLFVSPVLGKQSSMLEKQMTVTPHRGEKRLPVTPSNMCSIGMQTSLVRSLQKNHLFTPSRSIIDQGFLTRRCLSFSDINEHDLLQNYVSIPEKIMEFWAWLSVLLRRGFTSVNNWYNRRRSIVLSSTNQNRNLALITAKLEELSLECSNIKENFALQKNELESLRKENRKDFDDIKKQLEKICLQLCNTKPVNTGLPPPPPPLPPPPQLTTENKTIKTTVTNKKKTNEPVRPVISLEDILKVKLRKTSERVVPRRKISQTSLLNGRNPSPNSSLNRLVQDTATRRVKRLHRSSYSFDNLCRRSPRRN